MSTEANRYGSRGRAHPELARRSLTWSAWIFVLVTAVAGAGAAEVFCHEEHAADQHCAVCQLRHQPAAELSGWLQIGFADVAERLEQPADGERIASGHSLRLPARGPPA